MNMRVKLLPGFENFWLAYGHKLGRHMALKAWEKHKLEDIADDVVASIAGYDKHLAANPWKHKAHASTYLNQFRWQDEYPEAQSSEAQEDQSTYITRIKLSDEYRAARDEGRHDRAAELRNKLSQLTH